ncbi:hypothetical protein MKX03_025881 [Papaver bracteatum]|nr:hypothetical protein MKX03_025881 [Papaver bracteatum]
MNQETYFQSAYLVASPSYPNSVAWSDENLVAIASGHLVTILLRYVCLGLSSLCLCLKILYYPDLVSSCLLPTCLSRDARPCVRSLSWSRLGLAPNSGCLLAVCTTEGRVKLYRSPCWEFCVEWIEEQAVENEIVTGCWNDLQNSRVSKKRKGKITGPGDLGDQLSFDLTKEDENGGCTHTENLFTTCTELACFPCSLLKKGSSVEFLCRMGISVFGLAV